MVERSLRDDAPYSVCFLDVRMPPGWDGGETLERLWQVDPRLHVVLCSAYSDYPWGELLGRFGDSDQLLLLRKPFEVPEVRQIVRTLVKKWHLARENEDRLATLEDRVVDRTRRLHSANAQLRQEIDERTRVEARLRRVQRMEALGRLAAGIGHEINNPLCFMQGSIEALEELVAENRALLDRPTHDDMNDLIAAALTGCDRIARIVRNIRGFVRPRDDMVEPVEISSAIQIAIGMVGHKVAESARIDSELTELPPVLGKRVEIEQLFVNLLENAAHATACRDDGAGAIRITTYRDGETLVAEVADNGSGITREAIEKIFDPFFTTKSVDEGTGLGLSVCHSIMSALDGTIDVQSTVGEGTVFALRFPVFAPAALDSRTKAERDTGSARGPDNEPVVGKVLVVDDEPLVLDAISLALRAHEVHRASSARIALELCRDQSFDAILCDLMMPDMSGMDLFRALAGARPGLERSMIFISGGTAIDDVRDFLADVPNECLDKPIESKRLRRRISDFIADRREASSPGSSGCRRDRDTGL